MMDGDDVKQNLTNMTEALTSIKCEQASSDEQSEEKTIVDEISSGYFMKIGVGILESKVQPVDLFVNEYYKTFLNNPCKQEYNCNDSSGDHDVIRVQSGVWSVTPLRKGKKFGPYPETAFEARGDAGNTGQWISSLRKVELGESCNIETLKIGGQVFYKTICDIPTNTELVLSTAGKTHSNIDRVVRIGHQHRCPDCGKVFSMLSLLDSHKSTHHTGTSPNPIKDKMLRSQDSKKEVYNSQRYAIDTCHETKPVTQLETPQVSDSSQLEIKPYENVSLENNFNGSHAIYMRNELKTNEVCKGNGTQLTEAVHGTKVKYETWEFIKIEPKCEKDPLQDNKSKIDILTTDIECRNLSEGQINEESITENHGEHSRNPVENVDFEEQECSTINNGLNKIQENLIFGKGLMDAPSVKDAFRKCQLREQNKKLSIQPMELQTHRLAKLHTFKCKGCDESFSSMSKLNLHFLAHLKGKFQYKCEACGKEFNESDHLKSHILHNHTNEHYQCQLCNQIFSKFIEFRRHQQRHVEHKCDECGKIFRRRDSLAHHKILHAGVKAHRCEECGKCYPFRYQLIAHQRIHSGEKPYKCEECGKEFRLGQNLKRHMTCHTKERPWPCEICGKCFKLKVLLQRHMIIHNAVKSHKCHVCPRSFHRSYDLRAHILYHTDYKPHKCRVCQKSFRHVSHVYKHMRCHSNKKEYKCLTCGELFSDINSFRFHKSHHTGRAVISCPLCGKTFSAQANLKIHQGVHSGDKPFSCESCGKKFRQRWNLKIHLKIHSRSTAPQSAS